MIKETSEQVGAGDTAAKPAGGLEAFEAFFHACPLDSGMAFVPVPHLDPGPVHRGKHFESDMSDAFLAGFGDFVTIAERCGDGG